MHANEQLITDFYTAFQNKDGAKMGTFYHKEATFNDPVFPNLESWQARAMWAMLCERAKDFSLEFKDVQADDNKGKAFWIATYTFAKTGNTIVNKIQASFTFKDGKFLTHNDKFSLWKWSGMALGISGKLLGWTPMIQGKIRKEAQTGLAMYIKRKRLGPDS